MRNALNSTILKIGLIACGTLIALAVGEMAPNFELPGATRYGVLDSPVRLSDYRGETVVLAFFFRVRTRG